MRKEQLEDKKSWTLEEIEIGGKRKKIPFKERTGVCGCGVRRTDDGGRMADCGFVEGECGPEPEGLDRDFIRQEAKS